MNKLTPRKTEVLSSSFEDISCNCDPEIVKEKVEAVSTDIAALEVLLKGSNNVAALRTIKTLKERVADLSANISE